MKYAPIGVDLMDLLIEMGYDQKKDTDDKLIDPENLFTNNTLKEKLSDAFTHYCRCAGIEKNFTLKHLRKTYLTWVKQTMGERTNKLSSHSSMQVLKDHYLDPTIIDAIEIAALNVKIFG
jgi:integrase